MKPAWRTDAFGRPNFAFYAGNAYIGAIQDAGAHVKHFPLGKPWRGWFMSDDDGRATGWFATADEARASVEAAFQPEETT